MILAMTLNIAFAAAVTIAIVGLLLTAIRKSIPKGTATPASVPTRQRAEARSRATARERRRLAVDSH